VHLHPMEEISGRNEDTQFWKDMEELGCGVGGGGGKLLLCYHRGIGNKKVIFGKHQKRKGALYDEEIE